THSLAINGGTLTSANTVSDVVVLQNNTAAAFTINAAIADNGGTPVGLTKGGPGTLILGGANKFTWPVTVSGGTLQADIATFSGNVAVNAGANLTCMETGSTSLFSTISVTGAGTLTKAGSQAVTAMGVPSGGLSVLNGAYYLGSNATISGPVAISAGTFGMQPVGLRARFFTDTVDYNAAANRPFVQNIFSNLATLTNYYNPANTPTLTTPTLTTLTSANGNAALHFDGTFNALGWANGNDQAAIFDGNITIATSGSYTFGTNSDDGSMIWIDNNLVVNNNNYQGMLGNGNPAYSNQQTGAVPLSAGQHGIVIGYYQGNGNEGLNVDYSSDGGNTWNYLPNTLFTAPQGLPAQSVTIGPLSGSGTLSIAGTLAENATASSTFSGAIAGYGTFLKLGGGTLTLTSGSSTFNGTVRPAAGLLKVNNTYALQYATVDMNAADTGTLNTSGAGTSLSLGGLTGSRNLAGLPTSLTIGANNASTTYSGNLTGATRLTKVGTGTLTLTGTGNALTNGTIIKAGAVGSPVLAGTAVNLGYITLAGTGSNMPALELSGGTYSASLGTLASGVVQWTGNGGFSASGGSVAVNLNGGGTLVWGGTSSGGTAYFIPTGSDLVLGSATANNLVDFQNGLNLNGQNRTVYVQSGSGLVKDGPGTLALSNSNTYSGGTTINGSGVLRLDSAGALPTGSSLAFGITSTGTLRLNGNSMNAGSISGGNSGTVIENGNNSSVPTTLTVSNSADTTLNETIQDGIVQTGYLSLLKTGSATLTLTASNNYSGGTTLLAGGLSLAGSGAGSGILVIDAGTLQAAAPNVSLPNTVDVSLSQPFVIGGSNNLTLAGNVDLGGANQTINVVNTGSTTLSGVLSHGGLVKSG
ncbi:MAG: autotransporter-associated beta strand repeat-containing protein, partial [Thermoguttaceae bacterium]